MGHEELHNNIYQGIQVAFQLRFPKITGNIVITFPRVGVVGKVVGCISKIFFEEHDCVELQLYLFRDTVAWNSYFPSYNGNITTRSLLTHLSSISIIFSEGHG